MGGERGYLSTAEVARRLGVKPDTVYAYVSRGLLTSLPRRDRRRGSLFAEDEVARVAERAPHRRRPGADIRTELTELADDGLYYRGRDVAELATTSSPEAVARLLWTGEPSERPPFPAPAERVALARSVTAALPDSARLTDRIRVAVVALGAADPLRFDLSTGSVVRTTGELLGVLADALTPDGAPGRSLARRLWPALSPCPEPSGLLDAALVLLADHGLAVSTVAARVAASARAHPYPVVSAALGALDGHYHGAASGRAHRFLADARRDPVGAMSERMRAGEGLPGFGHRIYRHRDPRASVLLTLLRERPEAEPVMVTVDAVLARLDPDRGQFPNADLALAALMHAYEMPPDAGEAIFAVARTVGWVAHALEEYAEPPLRACAPSAADAHPPACLPSDRTHPAAAALCGVRVNTAGSQRELVGRPPYGHVWVVDDLFARSTTDTHDRPTRPVHEEGQPCSPRSPPCCSSSP